MNNVTSLAALATDAATQIFAGTGSGVVIAPFLLSSPQQPPSDHRYFSGPRWLASHSADADENSVLHLAAFTGKGWSTGIVGGGGGVWCVTRKGLSLLEAVPLTQQKKADHLQVQLRSSMQPLPTARPVLIAPAGYRRPPPRSSRRLLRRLQHADVGRRDNLHRRRRRQRRPVDQRVRHAEFDRQFAFVYCCL